MITQKVVILASGGGSNASALLDLWANGPIEAVGIWTNRKNAGVWNRDLKVPVYHFDPQEDSQGLLELWQGMNATALVLAGYLKPIPTLWIQAFGRRCYNIHPSLLPAFGGHGMYGRYIHEAVVAAGCLESGLSIHRVSEVYDEGPVLFQMRTLLRSDDHADSLAARILEGEHWAFGRVVAADLLGEPLPTKLPEGWYR